MQMGKTLGGVGLMAIHELMYLLNRQREISGGQLDNKSGVWEKFRVGDRNLRVIGAQILLKIMTEWNLQGSYCKEEKTNDMVRKRDRKNQQRKLRKNSLEMENVQGTLMSWKLHVEVVSDVAAGSVNEN